jgi:16S rRNA (guanine527-N7)-methyltransferase
LNHAVHPSVIAELLNPYIVGLTLPDRIYEELSVSLDLLLRWNAKTNLTAIRDPEQMVTRHFGESLFAAHVLFGSTGAPVISTVGRSGTQDVQSPATTLADLGSGAGFPGLPIKLAFPRLCVTLIESQNKKATFLREVIRALRLEGIDVYAGRAEQWGKRADVVTLRAVERFESVLPVAAGLLATGGRLCLLIGASRKEAVAGLGSLQPEVEIFIPGRPDSMVVVGSVI